MLWISWTKGVKDASSTMPGRKDYQFDSRKKGLTLLLPLYIIVQYRRSYKKHGRKMSLFTFCASCRKRPNFMTSIINLPGDHHLIPTQGKG